MNFSGGTEGDFVRAVYFLWPLLAVATADGQALTPAWVELGEQGQAIVRIVVSKPEDCPSISINGAMQPMKLRAPVLEGLRPACELSLPREAKSASVNGQTLVLPRRNPLRVIALGDTGCRVKGARVQDCNDPGHWPFPQVAGAAAEEEPDLVIHVGDYLYREDPCPETSQNLCGGTPSGDNWAAWNADFFAPAAKLLAAAPWAFSRGNHEDCKRSWRGWFYYLDPRPLSKNWADNCETYSQPYVIRLGKFELAMLDSSPINEDKADPETVAEYAKQLRSIASSLRGRHAWLADHHPFWGMKAGAKADGPVSVSAPLQEAWSRTGSRKIDLILSGHIHLFELLSFEPGNHRPPQLVAGDGGTDLAAAIQSSVNGAMVRGAKVMAGESERQFGFTVLERSSKKDHVWHLTLKNRARDALLACTIVKDEASCGGRR